MNQKNPSISAKIQRLTYSVTESAEALGVSKPTVYRLIARGLLQPIPSLRHKLIPCEQIRRFVSGEAPLHGPN